MPRKKAKYGRNLKGQVKRGYCLGCTGTVTKAKPKKRGRKRRARR